MCQNVGEQSELEQGLVFPEGLLLVCCGFGVLLLFFVVIAVLAGVFPQCPVVLGLWDGQELLSRGSGRAWGGRAAGDAGGIPGFQLGAGSMSSQE